MSLKPKTLIFIFSVPIAALAIFFALSIYGSNRSKRRLDQEYSLISLPPGITLISKKWTSTDPIDDVKHWEFVYSTSLRRQEAHQAFKQSFLSSGYSIEPDTSGKYASLTAASTRGVYINVLFAGSDSVSGSDPYPDSKPDRIYVKVEPGARS